MQAFDNMPAAITEIFGELNHNSATIWRGLGGAGYIYDFSFRPGYSNIFHNAHGLIRMSFDNKNPYVDINENDPVTVEVNLFDHRYRAAGVKFRKINAKNPADAVKKVIAWFEKNSEAMKTI